MKRGLRNSLLVLCGVIILALPAAYFGIGAWLESAGGRQMLEKNLSGKAGMDIRLEGEFDLMLLPDIGVSGTELVIRSLDNEEPFASSSEYEISIALNPLFDGEVHVDWIRLTGGQVHPGRYRSGAEQGNDSPPGGILIPRVAELVVRDFQLVLPGGAGANLRIRNLSISDFADRIKAPFELEIDDMGTVEGWLLLDAERSRLDLGSLRLVRAGQEFTGHACIFLDDPVSINLVLEAGLVDLDKLRQGLPGMDRGPAESTGSESPVLRVRASIDELRSSGAVARGVVMRLGEEPVCGSD